VYQQTSVPSLENIPYGPQRLISQTRLYQWGSICDSGMSSHCDFCTIAVMYRHKLRKRPVAEVAAEYASFKGKVIIFWDDNIAGDLEYAKELFLRYRSVQKMVE
jgi:hypothetical protein